VPVCAPERVPLACALFLNELRVPHFGQLTREIRPRFVTVATTCPRSSPQASHHFSTRSPTA
jgi:hypothetical protein